MYLIDHPFVSDFVIETIKTNNYKIIATEAAQTLIKDETLNWISESDAITYLKENPKEMLYSNSENALSWLEQHLGDHSLLNAIRVFKDKFQFRELIQSMFPDIAFRKIPLEAIQDLSASELTFPFVIKPSVGFFSIGVHIIENEGDWKNAQAALTSKNLKSIFPRNVLDTAHFILESYIEGEEYAIDYYHNEKGEVVILNIMHHVFSSGTDTSDRVYVTSKAIIEQHESTVRQFLTQIGQRLQLANFPAHAEIRIDKNGRIVPIEINPLRFGGWCTTGDLFGVTLGFNAYQCLMEKQQPDWEILFKSKETDIFSLIVLDNNSGIEATNILDFDYRALGKDFEQPMQIRELDIQQFPTFGFVFTTTRSDNMEELYRILESDLRKYITSK